MSKARECVLKFVDSKFFKTLESVVSYEIRGNFLLMFICLTVVNTVSIELYKHYWEEKIAEEVVLAKFHERKDTIDELEANAKSPTHYVGMNGWWYVCTRPK